MSPSYFQKFGKEVKYTLETDANQEFGLRQTQRGALFAIGAYFSQKEKESKKEPALVVMPTGSGKTSVLMISAYQERATRVLIVTPSQIVRNQIAYDFGKLATLKKLGVFKKDIPTPKVKEHVGQIKSKFEWNKLKNYDVIVSTPMSISPAVKNVEQPPRGLFDLILVDEAHHKPAPTWKKLLESFPNAKRILFTATPFRQDEKEIGGNLIYYYSIKKAYQDGVFGEIIFFEADNYKLQKDVNIAQKAANIFSQDRQENLNHFLIARARSCDHANTLKEIYDAHTNLNLKVIHSGHRYSRVLKTIKDLKNHNIDGVICVNMLGEGFDFPELKIAAVHAPQKSLAVTLQFVGRLARTTAENIGAAKVISTKSDIRIEDTPIFKSETGASWLNIISGLSKTKVEKEIQIKETLEKYTPVVIPSKELDDLPLYNFKPRLHVKVYRTKEQINLENELLLPRGLELLYRHDHKNKSSIIFITQEYTTPDWSDVNQFTCTKFDLFLVYYHVNSKLLFINASKKTIATYETIASSFTKGQHRILPTYQINRILAGLKNPDFYNIGLRSRVQHSSNESYRTMAGPKTDNAIDPTDGQLYHRGHVFGSAEMEKKFVNIGYSSGSKIWSSSTVTIPELISWCKRFADLLNQNIDKIITGTNLDNLEVGKPVDDIPVKKIISIDWPNRVYTNPIQVTYRVDGRTEQRNLLDFDLEFQSVKDEQIIFCVTGPKIETILSYWPLNWPFYRCLAEENEIKLLRSYQSETLVDFLNDNPLNFYLSNFSRIQGEELFEAPESESNSVLGKNRYRIIDWDQEKVDIKREFIDDERELYPKEGCISIHNFLINTLGSMKNMIVFYDHTTGEAADLISIEKTKNHVLVKLYHCKSSSSDNPGAREKDIIDICGQAIKSLRYFRVSELAKHIKRRNREVQLPEFITGNEKRLEKLVEKSKEIGACFQVILVQPGISKSKLIGIQEKERIIASCDRMLRHSGAEEVRLWVSE